eukprot:11744129-Alexandrium_andersonii.AAC.1
MRRRPVRRGEGGVGAHERRAPVRVHDVHQRAVVELGAGATGDAQLGLQACHARVSESHQQ